MDQSRKSKVRTQAIRRGTLLATVFVSTTAFASTFGTLSNFDVVNDTGKECHGFEIELEGISVDQVPYTFGGTYIRYGTPTVTAKADGTGVIVHYGTTYSNGVWGATTPVAPAAISPSGHACYSGGPIGNYADSGCEHFGVSLSGNATKTSYYWLVEDPSHPGQVVRYPEPANIPAPVWNVIPVANANPIVEAQIPEPPAPACLRWGPPKWVKVFKTESQQAIDLNQLLSDDPVVPRDASETEIEWMVLQALPTCDDAGVALNVENELVLGGQIADGNEAVVRRYEFYKYVGDSNPDDGEVKPIHDTKPYVVDDLGNIIYDENGNPILNSDVGQYIGAQMAAVNLVEGAPPQQASVIVVTSGNGTGTVSGGGINCGATCNTTVDLGTDITLSATADANSAFSGWSGHCGGAQADCTLTVNADKSVTAAFNLLTYTLNVSKTGSGSVKGGAIDCGATCSATLNAGTQVSLTAAPGAGYVFSGWSGDCTGNPNPCTLTMNRALSVSATFSLLPPPPPEMFELTVKVNDISVGTVTSSPAGINCGNDCAELYNPDTVVTLTAKPAKKRRFNGWTGDCSGKKSCTVTMSQARTVGANFR